MKLQTLKLENFQGVKEQEYRFNGENASIYGDNGTGKTTVFNAVTWLLVGKPSTGDKNFSPKTQDNFGEDIHYLTHAVEAQITDESGTLITLRKEHKENYTTQKGSTEEKLTGHTNNYFIDGVPQKEKEYVAAIERNIGTEEQIQLLMIPEYFAEEISWQRRREILLEIVGELDDETMMMSDPRFQKLTEALKKPGAGDELYTVDEYKKIAAARTSEIRKHMVAIPARIDEADKAIPELDELRSSKVLQEEIEALEVMIQAKREAISFSQTSDASYIAQRQEIAELDTKIATARVEHMEQYAAKNLEVQKELTDLDNEIRKVSQSIIEAEDRQVELERKIKHTTEQREALYAKYEKVEATGWAGSETCPTCGQNLPDEELQKARESFNMQKSQQLEQINLEGQQYKKEIIEELHFKLESTHAALESIKSKKEFLQSQRKELEKKVTTPIPFEETPAYWDLKTVRENLQTQTAESQESTESTTNGLKEQVHRLGLQQDNLKNELNQYDIAKKQKKRIKELEMQEKQYASEYENIQKALNLCEDFIRWKVNQLTETINSHFKTVQFKLFRNQINGGPEEICEVLIPSDSNALVAYNKPANTGARINAGLEIINTLSNHWNKHLPVFVDNAESVTSLVVISSQLVRLVVSEKDKALRMELAGSQGEMKGA